MHFGRTLRITLFGALLAIVITGAVLWLPATQSTTDNSATAALSAPLFVTLARAEDNAITGLIQDEAGISAWYNAGTGVDLNLVKSVYRVIETQTSDYILGSVPVRNHTEEWHDVHLYVHKDGWFLAYYLRSDPIGKIIDWKAFSNVAFSTKLETVLTTASSAAQLPAPGQVTFYDFRYPNATKLMLLYEDDVNGNAYRIKVPANYVYYARSVSVSDGWLRLNGATVVDSNCRNSCSNWSNISATDFAPDVFHTVTTAGRSVLAILYRDTP